MTPRNVIACDLPAAIDAARLQEAIRRVVDRHDILRSANAHVLRIATTAEAARWAGGPADAQADTQADAREDAPEARRDEARFILTRAAGGGSRLIAAIPAAQADGRSLSRLMAEIATAYRDDGELAAEGEPPQYATVSAWLRDASRGAGATEADAFWRGYLAEPAWPTTLPIEKRAASVVEQSAAAADTRGADGPANAVHAANTVHAAVAAHTTGSDADAGSSIHAADVVHADALTDPGGRCSWALPASLRAELSRRAGDGGTWLAAQLAAAASVWLAQQPETRAVCVGVTVDGRGYDELRHAIGPYDKALPLVIPVDNALTCGALVAEVRRRLDEIVGWQDWFDAARRPAVPAGQPAYPIGVQVTQWDDDAAARASGGWRVAWVASAAARYAVQLSCELIGDRVEAHLDYDETLYAPEAIARLRQQLGAILETLDASSGLLVRAVTFLADDERARLAGRPTDDALLLRDSVLARFERQAGADPDAIAIVDDDSHVSYRCLNRSANRLARQLRARVETGPDVRIGLRLATLAEAPLAMLAAMKTGSAYVPLDPAWPEERTRVVLRDAGIHTILTSDALATAGAAPTAIVCDAAALWADRTSPAANLGTMCDGDSLAYVLYTSGTSGTPKGAMIAHRGLSNYLGWCVGAYGIAAGRGAVVQSPITFDFTITTLLAPLMAGRCVFTCRPDAPLDHLVDRLTEIGDAGIVKLTPTAIEPVWRLLAAKPTACRIGCLVIGGEALSESRALWALAEATGAAVVNEYGPTECVVGASIFRLAPGARVDGAIPIGRPIANTRLRLEKRPGAIAETWIAGELFIGGAGVARGYVNRPALTAQLFVPDPDPAHPGERLYRTGDVARAQTSGDLVYLGRRDAQVKIRGHRIELAEVEQAIRRHPAVAETVVTAMPGPDGRARLAAFLVPAAQAGITPLALRTYLAAILPEPAIPAAFHIVTALPATINGKVDLDALRETLAQADVAAAPRVAPRTEAEHTLHRLWREVLACETIGIDDHFFELGGDSILSIQLLARANQAGLRLRPKDMRDHPTIRALAEIAGRAAQAMPPPAPLATRALALGPMQARFFRERLDEPGHANQSILISLPADWPFDALVRALEVIVEQHELLRVSFEPHGDGYRPRLAPRAAPVPLTRIDATADDEEQARGRLEEAALAAQRSMTLDAAPLMRALFVSGPSRDRNLLYLVIHHLIVDHVSWTVLIEDIRTACEQTRVGQAIALPPATVAYAVWVEQLQARARRSDSLARARAYWLGDRWMRVPPLPIDLRELPRANRVGDEERVAVVLPAHETAALVHETSGAYNTRVLDLLVAAYALAYVRWSGSRALIVDLEGHGRDAGEADLDLSRTVGWFTSLYPVYIALTAPGELRRTLLETKAALRAVPDDGAAYGVLRYASGDAGMDGAVRDAPAGEAGFAEMPAPEVVFNYVGALGRAASTSSAVAWIPASPAPNRSARNPRAHLIEIGAAISDGELRVTFTYGSHLHRRATIDRLAGLFLDQLRAIVSHCRAQRETTLTPSDFPLAPLTQDRLDAIVAGHQAVEDIYPLSPTQQGILFHSTRRAGDRAYLVQLCAIVSGPLDDALFEESWRLVIRRHTALRTAFVWEAVDEPLQIVERRVDLPFAAEDWRGGTEEQARARLDVWLAAQRDEGLDLAQAPLHRFARLRLDADRSFFVWTYHHLLLDGWSTSNVLREVLTVYEALTAGATPSLPPARPYRDYIAWLAARPWAEARRYWTSLLSDVTTGTRLAVRRAPPRETLDTRPHEDEILPLSPGTSSDVAALARRLRITVSAVIQGAWALVLSRYAGQDDVLFGVTVSGRPYDLGDVEHRVGLFISTLPMRVRVDRARPLGRFLDDVNARVHDMIEHGYLPLVEIQRLCGLPDRERLFDSIVVFENYPMSFDFGRLKDTIRVEDMWSAERTNYPLTLVVGGAGEALAIKALYDSSHVEGAIVREMLERFGETLRWMTMADTQAVCDTFDAAWTDRGASRPAPRRTYGESDWARPLHRLFEARAAAAPDAPAVVDALQTVSYGDLNRRANRLARQLIAMGVHPGAYVAICVERSAEMVVAMLAVLKAGAAYVPIDAHFPARRIALVAARASLTIVDRETRTRLAWEETCRVVEPAGRDGAAIASRSGRDLTAIDTPLGQVAYMMFTSGSSGQPKGTLITHGNVARLFAAAFDEYPEQAGGVWCCFHSIAFDFSVWEIFGALLTGGRVVMTPYWLARSPDQFAQLVRREGVTMLSQTPSAFQQLLTVGALTDDPAPLALRWVVFGGEALSMPPLHPFCADLAQRGIRLINMYGITETTVHVTHRAMDDYQRLGDGSHIGQPLPDLRIHLLDRHLRPVPEGVAGEIHVAGDGVALGYATSARLTAERFVPNASPEQPGERLYRSGDLARDASGELLYLGRGDTQVKIRGFRVEVDEIRFRLLRCDGVRDALVRAVEDHAGDRVLAAYVVPATPDLAVTDLWPVLREHLPEHMVPVTIRLLDAFPLTANGKIDLAALPSIASAAPRGSHGFVPPQTWEQELVADVWRELLGLSTVGLHDDFFNAGGDSIKALRVVGRLKALGFAASIEQVFTEPTVARLARALTRAGDGDAAQAALAPTPSAALAEDLRRMRTRLPDHAIDAYPLTQLQLGMLFHSGGPEASFTPYHNVSTFTIQGAFHETRFVAAVRTLSAAHPALRTAFELDAYGMPVQIVYRTVVPPIAIVNLDGRTEAEQRAFIDGWRDAEKRRFFTYREAPLIRWHVAVCAEDRFYLSVTEHHAILDGWSVASLLTELFQIYVHGPQDAAHTAPYSAEANIVRAHALLERAALECPRHQRFWSDYLRDYAPLRLPSLRRDTSAAEPAGVHKTRVTLDETATRGVKALAHDARVPLKSVLLSAHLAVLGFLTNGADVVTGLVTHGRPDVDGAETGLGLFLNTLPLRLRPGAVSWTEWMAGVFDEEKRLLPYRRYPFAAMRDGFGRGIRLSSVFNYVNFHVYERLSDDVAVRVLDGVVHEETDFDLVTDFTLMTRTGEIDLTLAYNVARIGDEQAEVMREAYVRCLRAMVADPAGVVTGAWLARDPEGEPAAVPGVAIVTSLADRIAMRDPEGGRHLSAASGPLVLDRWLRPVAVGTIGEICVPEGAAPALAAAAADMPRAAERLVPHPSPDPRRAAAGARLLRTGEAGRYGLDGVIEACGRADGRLEINGIRIAADDVRAALRQQPGIVDAILSEGELQDASGLRVHIVAPDGIDADGVRAMLARLVPAAVGPPLVITIASLPLRADGSPDYAALPAADVAAAPPVDEEAPAHEIDAALLALWQEILRPGTPIARRDEFLQIGGNSILLLQLQFKIHARFGLNVSLATLAVNGSFERMCVLIAETLDQKRAADVARQDAVR